METDKPEPDVSEYESGSDDEIERILSKAADVTEDESENFDEDTELKNDEHNENANEKDKNSFTVENDDGFIEQNKISRSNHSLKEKKKNSAGTCSCCCMGCFCGSAKVKQSEENITIKSTGSSKYVTEHKETAAQRRGRGCLKCCKRFTAFLFSHIGLCSLVVAYSMLGGFIFMKLEAPNEKIARDEVSSKRKFQVQKLWNITVQYNIFNVDNWTFMADKVLKDFQTQIYVATKDKGWDGQDGDGDVQWSFAGALLYSITVITTIGYGHIAPKTDLGRMVTIAYALIGIPLTLLCLANLGSFLGDCFRFLYKHICLAVMWLCCPSQAKWSSSRKPRNLPKHMNMLDEENPLHNDISVAMEKDEKTEKIRVPILVSLILIALYILGGATLFATWENWDYLVGSYFCFITLSTVGFGDFVPGAGIYSNVSNNEKLIICCFYLIFGLSLIAMCFNLMQEEVRAKFTWLGQKFGIIESDD